MHEPAFDIREEEYILWDYGKGYVDALADTGLEPGSQDRRRRLPVVPDELRAALPLLPAAAAGRSVRSGCITSSSHGGMDEREVRALLVRAGYEPF